MAHTTWNLDATHTDVIFATKHMMVTTVRGKFATVEGSLQLDVENPAASRGSFSVKAASINTGVEQRDGHLRSADFLDTETYPEITFVTTGVAAKGGNDYAVTGDLTIRGVTHPITFETEFLGLYQSMAGARRAGFHGVAKVNREDWGLTWNVALETGGFLVGKDIKLEIDLAVEEPAAVVPATRTAAASAA
jgi:polyisoprenoid-binding protein YceI